MENEKLEAEDVVENVKGRVPKVRTGSLEKKDRIGKVDAKRYIDKII